MIRDAIREFHEYYYSSVDFKKWRSNFSREIYACLKPNIGLHEDVLITELCKVMSGQEFRAGSGRIFIESNKAHGYSTSGVEFDYIGENVKKELADMIIISAVTFQREVLFLKTAFIQNKNANRGNKRTDSWSIDQEQLFLLKNFPSFVGVHGIIDRMFGRKQVDFMNHSGTLGNYGLFTLQGDLAFLTARNVFCAQKASGGLSFESIRNAANASATSHSYYQGSQFCGRCHRKHCMDCFEGHREYPMSLSQLNYLPFFNNYSYALNVYEVVKDLTCFNIGEPSCAFGRITDRDLFDFTAKILHKSFGYTIAENRFFDNENENIYRDEGGATVILNRLELGKNYG